VKNIDDSFPTEIRYTLTFDAQLCERVEIEPVSAGGDDVPVRKALCSGFFGNSARFRLSLSLFVSLVFQ
jgi:hypothetical protein